MKRSATAEWRGGIKDGHGSLETQSQALLGAHFSAGTRFGEKMGTNPEELIAAAHASCFSMALASELEARGFTPDWIDTQATVTLQKTPQQWTVTDVCLQTSVSTPEISGELLEQIAQTTKATCPISRLLKCEISLEVRLMSPNAPELQETG